MRMHVFLSFPEDEGEGVRAVMPCAMAEEVSRGTAAVARHASLVGGMMATVFIRSTRRWHLTIRRCGEVDSAPQPRGIRHLDRSHSSR